VLGSRGARGGAATGDRRRSLTAAAVAALLAVIATSCGGGSSAGDEPWRAGHPDPSGLTFDQQAPGLCAFPVQYPAEAPAAIEYRGAGYVQRVKTAAPAVPPGMVIGHSGGWTVSTASGGLYLLTGAVMYQYRSEANC